MLPFKLFSLSDKGVFEKYTHFSGKKNCDLSFTNCYIWNPHAQWCVAEGFLIVRFNVYGGEKLGYCEPLGDGDVNRVLEVMMQDANEQGQPLRLFNMSEEFAQKIKGSSFAQKIHLYTDRAKYDYVYKTERLRTLSGKELQPKRNHVNQFKRSYNYRIEALTPAHYLQVKELVDRWIQEKEQNERFQAYFVERDNISRSFEHFEQLSLEGMALFVDDRMIAFTYGSPINDTTFDIHIEKADTSYVGVFAMINQQFIQSLSPKYSYVNREEDMGIPGLRKSKMSYHPDILYAKWYGCQEGSLERQVWLLWQGVFGDDDAFISTYISNYSSSENTLLTIKDGQVLSMVHIPMFYNKYGQVGYVYAVATLEKERGKGYSSSLIKKALSRMYDRGDVMCALIPSDEGLARWYKENFSFYSCADDGIMRFHMDVPFDFGTSIEEKDRGMFRIVDVEKYLQQYAKEYPELTFSIGVKDDIIKQNNAFFSLANGCVERLDRLDNGDDIDIYDVFGKYKIIDINFCDEDMKKA